MAEAPRDQNHVPTMLGMLDTDGVTPIPVRATPSHLLRINREAGGSDNGPANAGRDQNHVPAMIAVSSDDGATPVVLYADSDGKLLVDMT